MGVSVAMNIQFFTSLENDGAQIALHVSAYIDFWVRFNFKITFYFI